MEALSHESRYAFPRAASVCVSSRSIVPLQIDNRCLYKPSLILSTWIYGAVPREKRAVGHPLARSVLKATARGHPPPGGSCCPYRVSRGAWGSSPSAVKRVAARSSGDTGFSRGIGGVAVRSAVQRAALTCLSMQATVCKIALLRFHVF